MKGCPEDVVRAVLCIVRCCCMLLYVVVVVSLQ